MAWTNEILNGIETLHKEGTPGRIVVFGQYAEPILTGSQEEDVLVAAAEVGKGRIVCVAHDAYCKNFHESGGSLQIFHDNVKKWLTRGTLHDNASIIDAKHDANKDTMKSAKIIFWDGGPGKITSTQMEEFVRNGGGLFHCMTPWGWLQLNRGKSLQEAPYYNVLLEAGICYTGEYIQVKDNNFSVRDNRAKGAHLLRSLEMAVRPEQKIEDYAGVLKSLRFLPESVITNLRHLIEKAWISCDNEIKLRNTPSPEHPATTVKHKALLDLWPVFVEILNINNVKAPGVDTFPGDFSTDLPLKYREFEFKSEREDFYSTACYVPAAVTMKIEILSGNKDKDWQVMIGCHTDHLNNDKIRRWPRVNRTLRLTQDIHMISSPFGGLIYFISTDNTNRSIKVKIDNIVDAPHFNLKEGEKERENWKFSREAPGLWADIAGELITFTLPAKSVRHLEFEELASTMKIWDSVVRLYHDLRGTDVSKFRRQWIVADEQPSAGYMHSGYPIVTGLDVIFPKESNLFVLNGESVLKEGRWGVFHEIGHNMQRSEWTFEGTVEVTCNIFTLCAMDCICHLKPWIHSWLHGQLKEAEKYLKDGAQFQVWKSKPGVGLFIYAQLIHAFGWESFKKVFRKYEAMSDKEKPKDDQKKIDTWFLLFSEIVGYNLSPLAKFWGIGISVEMTKRLETGFPVAFLPDDETTKTSPGRVTALEKQFPNLVRFVSALRK